jgi:hypothetical protein
MDIYTWLLRQNGFKLSDTGYFVYANGKTDTKAFDGKLEFDITLISYKPNDSWVEKVVIKAHKILMKDSIPQPGEDCDYCIYRKTVQNIENRSVRKQEELF